MKIINRMKQMLIHCPNFSKNISFKSESGKLIMLASKPSKNEVPTAKLKVAPLRHRNNVQVGYQEPFAYATICITALYAF